MKKVILVSMLALVLLVATACATTTPPVPSPSPGIPTVTGLPSPTVTANPGPSPGANEGITTIDQASDAARRVVDEVTKLSEIDTATAVVIGNVALIGVKFDAQYKGTMTDRIKDMVSERARGAVAGIQDVVVTADAQMMKGIQDIADKVKDNRPINEITAEVRDMVDRINPSNTRNP